MSLQFRLAEKADAALVGANLRESDREELRLSLRTDPVTATTMSVEKSVIAWSVLEGGKPVAVFGVGPYPGVERVGVVWLLGSPELDRHPRALVQIAPYYLRMMARIYPRLVNAVDANNTRTRR